MKCVDKTSALIDRSSSCNTSVLSVFICFYDEYINFEFWSQNVVIYVTRRTALLDEGLKFGSNV